MVPRHYLKSAGCSARRRAHVDYAAVVRAYRSDALEERPFETSRTAERHEDAPQNFIAVRIPCHDPAAGTVLYIYHVRQRRVLEDFNHKGVACFGQVVRRKRCLRAVRAAHGNARADSRSPRAEDAFGSAFASSTIEAPGPAAGAIVSLGIMLSVRPLPFSTETSICTALTAEAQTEPGSPHALAV